MGMLGCWADGVHAQCRFCGDHPFTTIACPEDSAKPRSAACSFKEPTETPHFWDPSCKNGKLGCLADGVHEECRFCGVGDYEKIRCPASEVCTFGAEPTVPYYWEPKCKNGMLGCNADGVHVQCRFCRARPFEDIPCPDLVEPSKKMCTFPLGGEPTVPHFWDPTCRAGKIGCWADGIHAECRFCGEGVYENVTCPTPPGASVPEPAVPEPAEPGWAVQEPPASEVGASEPEPQPKPQPEPQPDPHPETEPEAGAAVPPPAVGAAADAKATEAKHADINLDTVEELSAASRGGIAFVVAAVIAAIVGASA